MAVTPGDQDGAYTRIETSPCVVLRYHACCYHSDPYKEDVGGFEFLCAYRSTRDFLTDCRPWVVDSGVRGASWGLVRCRAVRLQTLGVRIPGSASAVSGALDGWAFGPLSR
jgi:hypothetical protein